MDVVETDRLVLRRLSVEDAEFIRELVNDPDWLRHIGDRGVRTLEDAREFLLRGPIAMYARCGFGLYMVELREGRVPIGICGLLEKLGLRLERTVVPPNASGELCLFGPSADAGAFVPRLHPPTEEPRSPR